MSMRERAFSKAHHGVRDGKRTDRDGTNPMIIQLVHVQFFWTLVLVAIFDFIYPSVNPLKNAEYDKPVICRHSYLENVDLTYFMATVNQFIDVVAL